MLHTNPELWNRIKDFKFEEIKIELPFSKRLALENNWSDDYSERVIDEYKKFCYLACISDRPVTPSDEVDQAWHLHLIYSENYWEEYCANILQQKLHHGPTKGGQHEDAKYEDWYAYTKELYKREFGYTPPADLWPSSEIRFSQPRYMRRVDASKYFMFPKENSYASSKVIVPSFVALAFLTGCASLGFDLNIFTPLFVIIGVLAVLFLLGKMTSPRKKNKHNGGGDGSRSGCGGGCGSNNSGCGSGCGGGGCGG